METYIALLRGINVSGQKKVNMKLLKEMFETLGFQDVQTYIQSGNVVFRSKKTPVKKLVKQIQEEILKVFGFEVRVLIRTQAALQAVVESCPFVKEKGSEEDKIYIVFLDEEPKPENIEKLNTVNYAPERFTISGLTLYFYCPNGYGKAKLNNNLFESKLKVAATTRNWRTVNILADMQLP